MPIIYNLHPALYYNLQYVDYSCVLQPMHPGIYHSYEWPFFPCSARPTNGYLFFIFYLSFSLNGQLHHYPLPSSPTSISASFTASSPHFSPPSPKPPLTSNPNLTYLMASTPSSNPFRPIPLVYPQTQTLTSFMASPPTVPTNLCLSPLLENSGFLPKKDSL